MSKLNAAQVFQNNTGLDDTDCHIINGLSQGQWSKLINDKAVISQRTNHFFIILESLPTTVLDGHIRRIKNASVSK